MEKWTCNRNIKGQTDRHEDLTIALTLYQESIKKKFLFVRVLSAPSVAQQTVSNYLKSTAIMFDKRTIVVIN